MKIEWYKKSKIIKKSIAKLNYKNRLIKSIAGDDTMNLGMYEGKNIDINEVIDSAETVPFFAEYRLIVMENTGLFSLSVYFADVTCGFYSLVHFATLVYIAFNEEKNSS